MTYDLRIKYIKDHNSYSKEYELITDFIDDCKTNMIDMSNTSNVEAVYFESPEIHKHNFNNLNELLNFSENILK